MELIELIERIRAVLDEDEWIAIAAARRDDGREGSWTPVGLRSAFDARVDDHIARHDPARILRQVAATRKILDDILPGIRADEMRIIGEWGTPGEVPDELDPSNELVLALAEALGITP